MSSHAHKKLKNKRNRFVTYGPSEMVRARTPAEISLSDIVSAVDGPIVAGDFGQPHTNGACDHEGQCVLLSVWADVGEHMRRYLEAATLADVLSIAQGKAAWPGEGEPAPVATPTWAANVGPD